MNRLFASLAVLLLSYQCQAQVTGNLIYDPEMRLHFQQAEHTVRATVQGNVLVLEVNAMLNVRADSYLAIFHLSQLGQSAEEADSLMNERVDGLAKRLKAEKIPASDVFVDMLSFVPVYEYEMHRKHFSKRYQEVPAGFEIQKNIHIRFTDPRLLDRIVTAAAKEEIYDLVKVDYYVQQQEARYDTLRKMATKHLLRRIAQYQELGLEVSESHRTGGEKIGAYFPLERYASYQAHSRMSLNSRRKGQEVNDIRKASTLFYNKVPYSSFDIVVHPEITEPPVQFTYNLVVHCQLPAAFPPKQVKELIKYLWITEKGEVKELKI